MASHGDPIQAGFHKIKHPIYNIYIYYRSEGVAERDIGSLRMMGWGLMLAENSSVGVARRHWTPRRGFIEKVLFSKKKYIFWIHIVFAWNTNFQIWGVLIGLTTEN